MKLDLRFTARPLEELWCQTVVALVFQDSIGKADGVSGLDAKTSGYLTYLWKKGFLTGAVGDTLLVASQNMIKANKILLKGLGFSADYSIELLAKRAKEIGRALDKMAVNDIAVRIPVIEGLEGEYPSQLKAACLHLVKPFLRRHEDNPNFLLKMVVSVDGQFTNELESTVRLLKGHFSSHLDYTIIVDREGG